MQTKSPEVSVIIPTYQEEKYIANTLSKLVTINPTIEIVVVDGGSQDKTVNIARQFTDKVYQIQKRGISRARNHGAKQADGDILVFLDSDVYPPANFVEKVLETFDNPTVVGATCHIMPTQSRFAELAFFYFYNLLIQLCTKFKPHSRGEFLAVRKNDFLEVDGFDENMPCLEDHDLAYRLSKRGKFIFIRDLTVYESMRRFRKLGFFKVVGTWFTDYLFFVLRGKPLSDIWQPVR
ncbi:MAG: glycosyltransferase [Candidatus Korarchaeota archaeon]|nr:glycosyltransferase [Candidatus Korarchaeota archaeon]NIW13138.1 glycosyltransferase [Candidatus Thorarchaeota archaeon]